jgi:hypothetical protein
VTALHAPVSIPLPAPVNPLPTSLPPTPQSPFPLHLNSDDLSLRDEPGDTFFSLNDSGLWQPVIPNDLHEILGAAITPVADANGVWSIRSAEGNLLFLWDVKSFSWMQVSALDASLEGKSIPRDGLDVTIAGITIDELLTKTDQELMDLAPHLKPEDFKIDAETLSPTTVMRIGEARDQPYLLYADQDGTVKLGWNVQKGELEYASLSEYTDPETGFAVQVLLINDNSMVREGKRILELRENEPGLLAQGFFDYTLSINYFYTHHLDEFLRIMQADTDQELIEAVKNSSQLKIQELVEVAHNHLREDITSSNENAKLEFRLVDQAPIRLDKSDFLLTLRLNFVFSPGFKNRHFSDGNGFLQIIFDLPRRTYLTRSISVGGLFVETLRELTFAGATYEIDSQSAPPVRSTTDDLVFLLCGKDITEQYLRTAKVGRLHTLGIVPVRDRSYFPQPPTCIYTEKQMYTLPPIR